MDVVQAVYRRRRLEEDSCKERQKYDRKSNCKSSARPMKDMCDLRRRFLVMALVMPLFFTLVFTHYVLKMRNADSVERHVEKFYQCLLKHPDGGTCPETYKDLQYPILAVASHCVFIFVCLLLLVFIFTTKDAREVLSKEAAKFLRWFSCYKQNWKTDNVRIFSVCVCVRNVSSAITGFLYGTGSHGPQYRRGLCMATR